MLARSLLALTAALLLAISAAVPALAGGFAVTTLDSLPAELQAGQTYRIGYTIRQHGLRPFPDAETGIRIVAADGGTYSFPAQPEGEVGHYVAAVRFPAEGVWRWVVDQRPFEPQPLGTVRVLPGAGSSASAVVDGRPSLALWLLRIALPIATLGAWTLLAVRLAALMRRSRPTRVAVAESVRALE